MGVIAWIIVGLLAGGIARRVVKADKRGCLPTLGIGVAGSFIGGGLYRLVRGNEVEVFDGFDLLSVVVASVGAVVLLLVLEAFSERKSSSRK